MPPIRNPLPRLRCKPGRNANPRRNRPLRLEALESRDLPATIAGVVFLDADRDGQLDPAETGRLANATVTLSGVLTDSTVVPPVSVVTGLDGAYEFTGLDPGTWTVAVDLPPGYAFSPGGPFSSPSRVITILTASQSETDENFGAVTGVISGFVYYDVNQNGSRDGGEPGLGGVPVLLTGTNPLGPISIAVLTEADGSYTFSGPLLLAGTYTITQTQPTGYGSSEAPGNSRDVVLGAGQVVTEQNFGETLGSISGTVYLDLTLSGTYQPTAVPVPDQPLPGVVIRLLDSDDQEIASTLTDAAGNYSFADLPTGTYTVVQQQPPAPTSLTSGVFDGVDNLGNLGGLNTVKNRFTLTLGIDPDTQLSQNAVGYNFGEFAPAQVSGSVYIDANRNGTRQSGERGIAGVRVSIAGTAFAGTPLARPLTAADVPGGSLSVLTDAAGTYTFSLIPPGVYTVTQRQPAGLIDGPEQNGDANLPAPVVSNDSFADVVTAPFPVRGPFHFGEYVPLRDRPPLPPLPPPAPPPISQRNSYEPILVQPTPGLPSSPDLAAVGRSVRPGLLALAQNQGGLVRVFETSTGQERFRFRPFGRGYNRGVRVAVGDINGDGLPDLVTATAAGPTTTVRVFNGNTGKAIASFRPFGPSDRGGAFVACGDLNNDGRADIVVGSGRGLTVRVIDGTSVGGPLALLGEFQLPPTPAGATGVRVAVGDIDNDGTPDIATTTARGRGVLRAFDGTTIASMSPSLLFSPLVVTGTAGATLSLGDVNGDGFADVAIGTGTGTPLTRIFNGASLASGSPRTPRTLTLDPSTADTGVRVLLADLNGDGRAELIQAASSGARPVVTISNPRSGDRLTAFYAFANGHLGGVELG